MVAPVRTSPDQGRREHYGEFYGLRPLPDDGRPLLLVHGNCQAEALRVLLAGAGEHRTVRVPPVHELEADDLPHLDRVLAAATVLVTQPVRVDYRDLPLGTAQVADRLAPGAVVVVVPAIRYAGLTPFQAIVRAPGVADPPVVPYHDLRTLAEAATGTRPGAALQAAAVRAVAGSSVDELSRREQRHGAVVVSDLLAPAGAGAVHTVNHPGNELLRGLAGRVLARLGHDVEVPDPGRTLLDSVHTPLHAEVLDALGLDPAAARPHWLVGGQVVEDGVVREAQLRFYAEHPQVVPAGLERHRDTMALLALVT